MFSLGEGIFVFCWILSFWLDQVTPFGTQKKCHYLNENYIIGRFRIQKMTHQRGSGQLEKPPSLLTEELMKQSP